MILGSLSAWEMHSKYENPVIVEAIEELKVILQHEPDLGRIEIRGNEIYVSIMALEAKSLEEQVAEKHETYIDVHYLIEGKETIGWSPLQEGIDAVKPYDAEADYALYPLSSQEVLLTLEPGMFAVFFPHDVHRPGMGQPGEKIKKAVIKIHVGLLNS
ncbi:Toxin-antitoxin biofilm protein TabA [compost metagenome]